MKPKFTPGPWHVERLVDDCGQCIAEWGVYHPGTECEETTVVNAKHRSDALLIAAAPEMYEALESVIDYFEAIKNPNIYDDPGTMKSLLFETARKNVGEALKKARGQK